MTIGSRTVPGTLNTRYLPGYCTRKTLPPWHPSHLDTYGRLPGLDVTAVGRYMAGTERSTLEALPTQEAHIASI